MLITVRFLLIWHKRKSKGIISKQKKTYIILYKMTYIPFIGIKLETLMSLTSDVRRHKRHIKASTLRVL